MKAIALPLPFRERCANFAPVRRWQRLSRALRWTIIGLVVFLILLRLALPYLVKSYVNKQLNKMPEYSGNVSGIDIDLWRGAYVIRNLAISKTSGTVPVPFFSTPRMDLSIEWKELFHGSMVGEIFLDHPEL